jgi:hypothetical protein
MQSSAIAAALALLIGCCDLFAGMVLLLKYAVVLT